MIMSVVSRVSVLVRGLALALLALILAGYAARDALVQSAARSRPEFVLGLDPTNATALRTSFRSRLAEQSSAPVQLDVWAERARSSLLSAPLSVAMVSMVSTDPTHEHAQETLHLAEQLSRRDSLTQLALIEIALRAGKVNTALLHYDRALSIYPDMRTILFPVLANAIARPAVQQGIVALARQQRPWINTFFAFAVQSSEAPEAVASTLAAIDHGPRAVANARLHEAALAKRLTDIGRYALARRVAMRAAGPDAAWIDRAGFAPATWARPTRPLTWSRTEDDAIDTQLQPDNHLLVSILPGRSGLAVFRVLVLEPGPYRFTFGTSVPQDMTAAPGYWNIICLRTGSKASSLALIPLNPAKAISTAPVTITPDCAAVRLDFTIDNINGGSDAGVLLHDVGLTSAR